MLARGADLVTPAVFAAGVLRATVHGACPTSRQWAPSGSPPAALLGFGQEAVLFSCSFQLAVPRQAIYNSATSWLTTRTPRTSPLNQPIWCRDSWAICDGCTFAGISVLNHPTLCGITPTRQNRFRSFEKQWSSKAGRRSNGIGNTRSGRGARRSSSSSLRCS